MNEPKCNCLELVPGAPLLVVEVLKSGAHFVGCNALRIGGASVEMRQPEPSPAELKHADSIYGVACLLRNELGELIERTLEQPPTTELALFAGALGGAKAILEHIVSVGPPVRPRIARFHRNPATSATDGKHHDEDDGS